jgi:hypothetical protein
VRDAATHYSERGKGKLDFWGRPRQPFVEIKRDQKAPYIDRDRLEETVDRYLRLPYRCADFDRLLADMLAAAELYAYGETVIVKNPVAWIFAMSPSPLYPRPIRSWIIGQVWNLVIFGIPIGIAWWLASKQWIDEETALWITFGSGGIFLLLLGISILAVTLFVCTGHPAATMPACRIRARDIGAYQGHSARDGPLPERCFCSRWVGLRPPGRHCDL